MTDQKKKAKAKPRKEKKGKKKEKKKHIFSFWTNKKFASYARVKWGEGEGGKHFCRQFSEGFDSTLYICWGTNNARRTCNWSEVISQHTSCSFHWIPTPLSCLPLHPHSINSLSAFIEINFAQCMHRSSHTRKREKGGERERMKLLCNSEHFLSSNYWWICSANSFTTQSPVYLYNHNHIYMYIYTYICIYTTYCMAVIYYACFC